ncbi:MAG: copper resistance protein CopC [Austwickia sp.]|nr:copper resistance protein CopC [Actinomycetota bacterium]MCB1254543.1 copper resistance protein CopC [Austwickia sp.]
MSHWAVRLLTLLALALGLSMAILSTYAGWTPAYAHSQLMSSTPADGAQLATMPAAAEFTFSEDIMDQFSQAVVVGADGELRTVTPTTQGPRVTVPLSDDLGTGKITVRYKVTSKDAHPIAGEICFTVGNTSTSDAPTSTGATMKCNEPDSELAAPRTDEPQTNDHNILYVLAGVGAAVLIGGGAFLLRGQNQRKLP